MPCASLHKTSVLNTSKNNDKGNRTKSSDVILVSVHNFVQLCTNFEHVFFCLKRARSLQKRESEKPFTVYNWEVKL